MAFNLQHYSTTFQHTSRANFSSQAMQDRYPFICSREALYQSLDAANVVGDSQRNPNGYTLKQMTDKIIAHWDAVMFDHWGRSLNTDNVEVKLNNPLAFANVSQIYNWSQSKFWSDSNTSFIAFDIGSTGNKTAAQVVAATDIILLPSIQYDIDTIIYKQKPFLAFDYTSYITTSASTGATLIGTDDFGVELTTNSSHQVTAITGSGISDDPKAEVGDGKYPATLLHIYDFNTYHDDLNPNGSDFSVNDIYSGHDVLETSTKWFDLRRAKFSVTTSGGAVTAVTATARTAGDGSTSVSGGWDYSTIADDYFELYFILKQPLTTAMITPRVLFRTNSGSSLSGKGQKATVDITDKESEFFEGLGITSAYIDTAFAVPSTSLVNKGHTHTISATSDEDKLFTQRNWPSKAFGNGTDPAVVRIVSERPSLQTTSKGLKTTTIGTATHRFRFEFEYPPMNETEAQHYIEKFESFKGNTLPMQLYIPSQAIQHVGNWSSEQNATDSSASGYIGNWSTRMTVESAAKGSDLMILGGHSPATIRIPDGTYFFSAQAKKIYQIVGVGNETPDIYGRVPYIVEPPFVADQSGDFIVLNHKTQDATAKNYLLVKAFLEDSFLDYTVDAAGIYRMQFKFREAI